MEEEADDELEQDRSLTPLYPRSPSPQPGPSWRHDAADDDEFERYCTVLHARPQYIRKFNIVGYQMCFHINSMAEELNADQQYALFLRISQRIINDTVERAHENGHEARSLGFAFKADGMKKTEYLVPFRPPEENNAEKLGEEVYNFEQSAGGVQVIGNNCRMKVTVCRRTVGAGKKDGLHTKGEQADIEHALLEAASLSRYGPNTPDNLCLFKAIAVSKLYAELKHNNNRHLSDRINSFRENKRHALEEAVEELMRAVGLNMYEVDIHDQSITYGEVEMAGLQAYFDRTSPNRYRIVAFSEQADTNAIWKGPNTAPINVCIYHHTSNGATNGHYVAVKTAQKLFARANYCFECEVTFAHASYHTAKCKAKCINCLRIGYGRPCDGTDRILCNGCKKIFTTRDCFEAHHKIACKMYKKCETCGK
jgi:hypothetical protein